jgi:molybdate transport system substrate-binding protein
MKSASTLMAICALAALAPVGSPAAAELVMFANQGALSGIKDIAPEFEKASGHKVVIRFLQGAAMNRAIDRDEPVDVVSALLDQFEGFEKHGKIVPGSWAEYARAGNGVAVRAGARRWDISTSEGFRRAMLEAKSIGHSNNGTGPFNTRLFQKLGIYEQVKDKIKIIEGGVAAAVARGEVEIGIQQTNVIQPVAGTEYLGPLPPELMEYGRFGVGLATIARQPQAGRALIAFMTSPAAASLLRRSAMEPPAK